jgi:hypothetical protein
MRILKRGQSAGHAAAAGCTVGELGQDQPGGHRKAKEDAKVSFEMAGK